ncbi:ImmA/IrrE family metallo-endopeptidase [Tessaracoccus sp. MC1627]|uniref:ImmA/IrrE family metallo-endopeptidase n=1 Tax=Tessaracoccus sp. MC1627 TaxID=2760312 RepID=UPI00351BF6B7
MVRDNVADAQAVKTLAHEAGHVLLHQDQASRDCRGILEVEAESVAYMVTSAHGLASTRLTT